MVAQTCGTILTIGLLTFAMSASAKEPQPAATKAVPSAKNDPATTKPAAKPTASKPTAIAADGRELFMREWLPKDSRSHGGDGLGPVFNDSSCVACHNQGGAGGGGAASKNVDIITAFANPQNGEQSEPESVPRSLFRAFFGSWGEDSGTPIRAATALDGTDTKRIETTPETTTTDGGAKQEKAEATADTDAAEKPATEPQAKPLDKKALAKQQKAELAKIHPGFSTARSVVLHRSGIDPSYDDWRARFFVGDFQTEIERPVENSPETDQATAVDTDTVGQSASSEGLEVDRPNVKGESVIRQTEQLIPSDATGTRVDKLRSEVQRGNSPLNAGTSQIGNFAFVRSQRNATALFGVGLIDSIPDDVLREAAKKKYDDFPEVQGRVSKLKDGKLGRFGWKAQKASLEDFALTACSVELGLEVPGHPQAGTAQRPDYKAPGLDMNAQECNALVKFLRDLPAPAQRKPATADEAAYLSAGEKNFAAVGCAACHSPKLGKVDGIYSDLLLHDMGDELGDAGNYGVFVPNSDDEDNGEPLPSLAGRESASFGPVMIANGGRPSPAKADASTIGAMRLEWRTPPLWGCRDSAPYLHDGRADTLQQAIAMHGGQGTESAKRFFELKPAEQLQVISFLKSLTAPEPDRLASASK